MTPQNHVKYWVSALMALSVVAFVPACSQQAGSPEGDSNPEESGGSNESSPGEMSDDVAVEGEDAGQEEPEVEADALPDDPDEVTGEFADGAPTLMSEDAFLAAFRSLEDVVETESGLMYRVIETGSGASPGPFDRVRVAYRGTLMDGTVFDETPVGESAEFPVSGLIPGWREALQLMQEGDRWELAIPSHLAYGERGAEGAVPPNSPLVFEVTLIAVLPRA